MPVQFEWRVEGDREETIAEDRRTALPPWTGRALKLGFAGIIVIALLGYALLRIHYERAREKAEAEIGEIMALEDRAFAQGDRNLFLEQQDSTSPAWYALQRLRVDPNCAAGPACPDTRFPGLCPEEPLIELRRPNVLETLCAPVSPAEIAHLELRGNVAWVEVVEGTPLVRRVRFYVKTPGGWKHTVPQAGFWDQEVRMVSRLATVSYHSHDQPYVKPLAEHIIQIADDVNSMLRYWPSRGRLEVEFAATAAALQAPYLTYPSDSGRPRLVLASPWLTGVPVEEAQGRTELNELTYWTVYALLADEMQRAADQGDLSQLQRAILSEYVAWYVDRDTTQAPILGRIIERHGTEALPRISLSLRGARLLGLFLLRWLSLHPQDRETFEMLLNIERESILVGQKETFMLLQDPEWMALQAAYFADAQGTNPYGTLSTVRVLQIDIRQEAARVQLAQVPLALEGHPPQTLNGYAFFRHRNWDWKHASTAYAALWGAQPLSTRVPAEALEPTPQLGELDAQ